MEVVWGTILDRVDRRFFILLALIGMSLLYPLYTMKALLPLFIALQFIFGAVTVIIGLTTRVVIADNIPIESSGSYMSLWFLTWAIFGLKSVFVISSGAAIVASLLRALVRMDATQGHIPRETDLKHTRREIPKQSVFSKNLFAKMR